VGGVESGTLSLGGLRLRTSRPLPIGSRLLAEIVLAGGEPALRLPAEVIALEPPAPGDPAKRFGLEIRFDDLGIDEFEKLAGIVVLVAGGRGGVLLRPAPASPATTPPSPLQARVDEIERRIDHLLAALEAERNGRLEAERQLADAIQKLEAAASRGASLLAVPTVTLPDREGKKEPSRPTEKGAGGAPPPRRKTTVSPTPQVDGARMERLDPAEFVALLESGQPLDRSPRFNQFDPTSSEENLVANWLESADDLDGLRRLASGRFPDQKLLAILQLFYRRGLVDFA
jgi:hypothetical protein